MTLTFGLTEATAATHLFDMRVTSKRVQQKSNTAHGSGWVGGWVGGGFAAPYSYRPSAPQAPAQTLKSKGLSY